MQFVKKRIHSLFQRKIMDVNLFEGMEEVDSSILSDSELIPENRSDLAQFLGKEMGKYQVIEEIGRGGMGVVYKAYDTLLDRYVAIKCFNLTHKIDVSKEEIVTNEARAASKLDHPNIASIYDIYRNENGAFFLVMGYYEGDSLRNAIDSREFSALEAMDIAIQIASALDLSHSIGVIHRDIKPSNIILTKGNTVKIIDFGLANVSGANKLDELCYRVGSLDYMAPEYLREKTIANYYDIWALGVVLYEMMFGKKPDHSTIGDVAEDVESLRGRLEHRFAESVLLDDLAKIIERSLAEDLSIRYESMGLLLEDLQKARNNYTINSKRRRKTLVTTSIIAAASLSAFLVFKYGPFASPAAIQATLADQVRPTLVPEAWDEFLKGQEYAAKETEAYLELAVAHYDKAIALDSTFADPYAARARPIYTLGERNIILPRDSAYARAERSARAALRLNDQLPEAHVAMGVISYIVMDDFQGARQWFDNAIELNPRHFDGHREYGLYLTRIGEMEAGIASLEMARSLQPQNLLARRDLAIAYYYNRDFKRMIDEYEDLKSLNQEVTFRHRFVCIALYMVDSFDEAKSCYDELIGNVADSSSYLAFYGEVNGAKGDRQKANEILNRLENYWRTGKVPAYHLSLVYSAMQEVDLAVDWLEVAKADGALPSSLAVDPRWDPLREDERFQAMLPE